MDEMQLIGLSLSQCVKDIIDGKVDVGQVQAIVAGTKCASRSQLEEVISIYKDLYWSANPEMGAVITRLLYTANKLHQPRVDGKRPPDTLYGHWALNFS